MSSNLKQKLQDILQLSIDNHQFEQAERAVTHLKELADIEAFIEESRHFTRDLSVPERTSTKTFSSKESVSDRSVLEVYYIEKKNLLKFKRPPQTYTVSVEFFRAFLSNLKTWKEKDAFSSKKYYNEFAEQLHNLSNYKNSTLRQFITLLFRFSYKLEVLEKPTPPQRSRYVVADNFEVEDIMEDIFEKKILQL